MLHIGHVAITQLNPSGDYRRRYAYSSLPSVPSYAPTRRKLSPDNLITFTSLEGDLKQKRQEVEKILSQLPDIKGYHLLTEEEMDQNGAEFMKKYCHKALQDVSLKKLTTVIQNEQFEFAQEVSDMLFQSFAIIGIRAGIFSEQRNKHFQQDLNKYINKHYSANQQKVKPSFSSVLDFAKSKITDQEVNVLKELIPSVLIPKNRTVSKLDDLIRTSLALELLISFNRLNTTQSKWLYQHSKTSFDFLRDEFHELHENMHDRKEVLYDNKVDEINRTYSILKKHFSQSTFQQDKNPGLYSNMVKMIKTIVEFIEVQDNWTLIDTALDKTESKINQFLTLKENNPTVTAELFKEFVNIFKVAASNENISITDLLEYHNKKLIIRNEDYYNFNSSLETKKRTKPIEKIIAASIFYP